MTAEKKKLPDLTERFAKRQKVTKTTAAQTENAPEPPEGLLSKIMKPKTKNQAQVTLVLMAVIVALVAGVAGELAIKQSSGMFSDQEGKVAEIPLGAITKLVEDECRGKPNASPTIYSGQNNVEALKAACNKATTEKIPQPVVDTRK